MNPLLLPVRGFAPKYPKSCFLAPTATLIGDVEIGEESSVWFQCTLRGDVMPIRIGRQTNIQDGTVIHGSFGAYATTVHDRVTIGHQVLLHGCEIHSGSLIGMGSIIMDGAVIGRHCLVGAGSLVTERTDLSQEGYLILGRPAKAVRPLKEEEIAALEQSADNYLEYSQWYLNPSKKDNEQ